MHLIVKDGSKMVWEKIELIRIVTGETTLCNYNLTEFDINPLIGNLNLNIIHEMDEAISFSIELPLVEEYDWVSPNHIVFEAITQEATMFIWILDGVQLEETSSIIFIDNLIKEKVYQLTVIAINGDRIGAETYSFNGDHYNWYHFEPK